MKPCRLVLPCLLGLALVPGSIGAQSGFAPRRTAAAAATTQDPFAPVHLVSSRKLFREGIGAFGRDAVERRDALGNPVVISRIQAHQLDDVSQLVHDRERRCGGYFAFATRAEAEAFVRTDRSAQAVRTKALVPYTIDNPATVAAWLPRVQEANIRATITHLSTAFPNRYYASNHGRSAAVWIRDTWLALGHGRADVSAELFTDCATCGGQPSVILTIRGTELPNEIVVLGGHLDSISSTGSGDTMNAPGADDDGSGIATLTEVIRIALASGWKPRRTVKFMGYAAEEVGLRGSQAIAQSFRSKNQNVVGVLQFDMTNYAASSAEAMDLMTDYSNPAMQQFVTGLFDRYLAPSGLRRGTTTCGYACSDHASWTAAGYPAAMMFEPTFFPWLHTPSDTLAQAGGSAAASVNFARLGLAFLAELAKSGNRAHADFDGDRQSDLFWRHGGSGANSLWRSADSQRAQAVVTVGDPDWKIAGTGDFDGDGRADLFWRNQVSGANVVWRAGSNANLMNVAAVSDPAWKVAGIGDFDADGKADVFWHNGSTGGTAIWPRANGAARTGLTSVHIDWQVVGAGDFSGDGRADVLWRNRRTGANVLWRSAQAAQAVDLSPVGSQSWIVAGSGDFDNDARMDILWRNLDTGSNVIWLAANGASRRAVDTVPDPDWKVAAIGDYDGDGRSDLLWRHARSGKNVIWHAASAANAAVVATVADPNWTPVR